MTVGFVVLAHDQPAMLGELVKELQPYRVFLHVDKSRPVDIFMRDTGLDGEHAVCINPSPRCLHWGGYSVLQAMMETLELAITGTDSTVNHFAFLSGRCYPLRPVAEFAKHLNETDHPVLCRGVALDGDREMSTSRVTRRHWLDGSIGHLKKKFPGGASAAVRKALFLSTYLLPKTVPNVQHLCGSQWVAVPRALASELVEHYHSGGFEYLRQSFAPDEVAIPSYVYSTEWRLRTEVGHAESCRNSKIAAFSNYHWLRPSMAGSVDFNDVSVAALSGQFFIRKMDQANAQELIKYIKSFQ